MQKYRLAILVPELVQAITKLATDFLDSHIGVGEGRDQEHDDAFTRLVFMRAKNHWVKEYEALFTIEELSFDSLPTYPRYTEVLAETNEAILFYGIEMPIIEWKGSKIAVGDIPEVWKCEQINYASDGDDYILSQVYQEEQYQPILLEGALTEMELGLITQAAFHLAAGTKQQQQFVN